MILRTIVVNEFNLFIADGGNSEIYRGRLIYYVHGRNPRPVSIDIPLTNFKHVHLLCVSMTNYILRSFSYASSIVSKSYPNSLILSSISESSISLDVTPCIRRSQPPLAKHQSNRKLFSSLINRYIAYIFILSRDFLFMICSSLFWDTIFLDYFEKQGIDSI